MIRFLAGNTTIIQDNYREANISFFNDNAQAFNFKRSLRV